MFIELLPQGNGGGEAVHVINVNCCGFLTVPNLSMKLLEYAWVDGNTVRAGLIGFVISGIH